MKRHTRAVGAALARGLATLAVIGVASLVTRPAAAQEFEIKSPFVDEGELEFEEHGNFQFRFPNQEQDEDANDEGSGGDDEENIRQFHELSIGYGVTDWWEPELEMSLQQLKHDDMRIETIGVENTFQLLPTNAHFFNLGLDLEYGSAVHDEIQSLEGGPLVQVWTGPFSNTINLLFEQEFGSDRESGATSFEYAWQTLYKVTRGVKVGFEAYGEIEQFATDAPRLSDQDHRIGPVAYYAINLDPFELSIGGGFLFGLTDATPDDTIKFDIELSWGG